uniref:Uncharacterized protein n=1 Tax=Babesia bovis TaxID=5865 RepID=S6B5V7_BABBO|nr:hypothetical protein [Babesia bovis]
MVIHRTFEMSPEIATPIRGYGYSSRLGLLVAGTVDDPIDIQSTVKRFAGGQIGSSPCRHITDGPYCTLGVSSCIKSTSNLAYKTPDGPGSHKSVDIAICVDWGTISTDEPSHEEFTKGVSNKSSTKRGNVVSNKDYNVGSPIKVTPAKKPKVSLRMKNASGIVSCGSISKDVAVSSTAIQPQVSCGYVPERVDSANLDFNPPRWKTLRHKVLLKLRRKQAHNNYDLAMFLLLKFGGPDTNAGRSVIRDKALIMCSSLSRFPNDVELRAFYLRERAALISILSQRVALNTYTPAQLHRKLAKMLPPNRWFNRVKLFKKVKDQEQWNPFSIFGSSLPYVSISDVFNTRNSKGDCCPSTVEATPSINWSSDPLMLDEVLWYLEATGKYIDKSRQVCTLQRCYCVTPDPHIAYNWNDGRNTAWRDYRGPRASMGQMLSPSIYEESILNHEKLQSELDCTTTETMSAANKQSPQKGSMPCHASNQWHITPQQLLDTPAIPAPRTGIQPVLTADLTPNTRRVIEQKVVFYRNYFKANQPVEIRVQQP